MSSKYKRPLPKHFDSVNYKENFELRYLRWDYFVRSENPDPKALKAHEGTISFVAGRVFSKYRYDFTHQGLEEQDVVNIARCFTVSYLSLYSIFKDPAKIQRFIDKSVKERDEVPTEKSFHRKESCNLMAFLTQRLEECASVFRAKSKNYAGFSVPETYVLDNPNPDVPWPSVEDLLATPAKFGWRKLPHKEYNKYKKSLENVSLYSATEIDGKIYWVVAARNKVVTSLSDPNVDQIFDYHSHGAHPSPQDLLIHAEEAEIKRTTLNGCSVQLSKEERIQKLLDRYKDKSPTEKTRLLNKLISWMKGKPWLEEETKLAQKLLNYQNKVVKKEKNNEARRSTS